MERGGSARRGAGVLALVMTLLFVAFAGVFAQGSASRHLSGQAAAVLAGAQATETARACLDDAFRELARIAVTPADPLHGALLRRLVGRGAGSVDLTDLVQVNRSPALSWKRARHAELSTLGTVKVEAVRVAVEGLAPLTDGLEGKRAGARSPDERAGVVVLEATVGVELAGRATRRRVVEKRELRLAVLGPARPFDQVGLYVSDLAVLTDAAKANAQRAKLLSLLDGVVEKIKGAAAGFTPEVVAELEELEKGLPSAGQREERLPPLPTGPATLSGLAGAGRVTGPALDLAARLEEDVREVQVAQAALMAELNAGGGGQGVPAKLIAALTAFNRAAQRAWRYQRTFKVLPRGQAEHEQLLAPYEERLSAAWYADRTALAVPADGPLMSAWAAGERALMGIVKVTGDKPLVLTGERAGRAVLIVDAPEVELKDLAPAATGDLVTVIATRGRVRIAGDVRAYVIAADAAVVEMAANSRLTGGLALAGRPRAHQLAGLIVRAPEADAGLTLDSAVETRDHLVYGLAISPVPVSTEGERR
jgi:hypothetical protein